MHLHTPALGCCFFVLENKHSNVYRLSFACWIVIIKKKDIIPLTHIQRQRERECVWEFKGFKLPNRKTNKNQEATEKYDDNNEEEQEDRTKTKRSGTIIISTKKRLCKQWIIKTEWYESITSTSQTIRFSLRKKRESKISFNISLFYITINQTNELFRRQFQCKHTHTFVEFYRFFPVIEIKLIQHLCTWCIVVYVHIPFHSRRRLCGVYLKSQNKFT